MTESQTGRGALVGGGLAAILASACCLGPLVLVTLGFSGAWIGNLTALEPYRPLFIGVALVAMGFAWRRIYRPAQHQRGHDPEHGLVGGPNLRNRARLPLRVAAVLLTRSAP